MFGSAAWGASAHFQHVLKLTVSTCLPVVACSEDRLLRQILSQSTGDVFNMIAAALQQAGSRQESWFTGPGAQGAAGKHCAVRGLCCSVCHSLSWRPPYSHQDQAARDFAVAVNYVAEECAPC